MATDEKYLKKVTVRLSDGYLVEFYPPSGYAGVAWYAERGGLQIHALTRKEDDTGFLQGPLIGEQGPLIGEIPQGQWLGAWRG